MAIALIFIFLSLCITISQAVPVSQETFANVKPMTIMGFENNLGTYVEYKGKIGIVVGEHIGQSAYNIDKLLRLQELFLSGYKALNKHCHTTECINLPFPNLKEFNDTFHDLSTIEKITSSRSVRVTAEEDKNDALRSRIKLFSESYAVSSENVLVMFKNLKLLASSIKKSTDILLEQMKCARFNNACPLEPEIWTKYFKNSNLTMSDFLQSATLRVGKLDNSILVFEYKIPDIDNGEFSMYRLTPIPKVHRNDSIEILDIKAAYLALDYKTDRYFALQDLEDCWKLKNNRLVCNPSTVSKIYIAEHLPCGVAAVLNQFSKACTSHFVVQVESLWTPLLAANSWMTTVTSEASLLARCSNDDEQELKINGSGILRIRGDCTIQWGTSVLLQGQHREWTDANLAYAALEQPSTAMRNDSSEWKIKQLLRDSVMKLRQEHVKPRTLDHQPYVIAAAVVLAIFLVMALLYWHMRPRQPRPQDVGPSNAYIVRFDTRSGKPETTGE